MRVAVRLLTTNPPSRHSKREAAIYWSHIPRQRRNPFKRASGTEGGWVTSWGRRCARSRRRGEAASGSNRRRSHSSPFGGYEGWYGSADLRSQAGGQAQACHGPPETTQEGLSTSGVAEPTRPEGYVKPVQEETGVAANGAYICA